MYAWIQRKKGLFFGLMNSLIAGIVILFFIPTYENNDDFFMGAIASGLFGKEYSQCLVFSNVVYGYLLKVLSAIISPLNWYVVAQYILIVISIAVIFYVVSHYVPVSMAVILNIIFWYLCFFGQIREIQFTRTAGLVVVAGCVLLWYSYRTQKSKKAKIFGMLLCVIGSMIRLECFPACFVFFLWLGICVCVKDKKLDKKLLFRLMRDTVVLVCLVGLFMVVNKIYYQSSEDWSFYTKYNSVRSNLMDYGVPDFSENKAAYKKLDFNQNDTIILANWILEDPDKFDYDTLLEISSWKENGSFTLETANDFAGDFLKRNFSNKFFYLWLVLLLVVLIAPVHSTCRLFAAGNVCGLGAMYFLLYYIGRIVPRVEYMIWLAAVFSLILCLLQFHGFRESNAALGVKLLTGTAVFFTAVLVLYYLNDVAFPHKVYAEEPAELIRELSEDTENCYLLNALCFGDVTVCYKPYLKLPDYYFSNMYYTGGWTTNSPFQKEWKERLELENPMADLVDRKHYYYVKYTDWGTDAELRYLRNNYKKGIRCKKVKTVGEYTIYQFTKKKVKK